MNPAAAESLTVTVEQADAWYRPIFEALRLALRPADRIVALPARSEEQAYRRLIAEADVVVGFPPAESLRGSPLRWLMLPSAGYDAYVNHGLGRRVGLTVTNAAGVFSVGLAEHALWLMLSASRQATTLLLQQRRHEWTRTRSGYGELRGATVCIVGFGNAGRCLATRCAALGMRVVGVRRSAGEPPPGVQRVVGLHDLDAALGDSDHVVLFLPGGPETKHLFDAQRLAKLKPNAWLYNLGRGSVIDEAALLDALRSGRLGGVGLDVFEREPLDAASPLWDLPRAILSPHVAGFSAGDQDRMAELVVHNYRALVEGRGLRNVVPNHELDPAPTKPQP